METRNCQNCKKEFTIEAEDFSFYQKMQVPAPTFCPDCRFQRRFAFRNNRVFYKRECGLCGKLGISVYSKERGYPTYCNDCWFSDKWDVMSYGLEYDFSKTFFTQFNELMKAVPKANLHFDNFISSEYCNYGMDFKNCHLLFGGKDNERVYFGNQVLSSKDSLDVDFSQQIEFSYEIFECVRANKLFYAKNSLDCVESRYMYECRNCLNCYGCVGLVNKQYCVFNKQYTKEQYEEFLNSRDLGSYKNHLKTLKDMKQLLLSVPRRYAQVYKSINSDGDELVEARNTHNAFSSRQVENSKFLFFCRDGTRDCYDNTAQGFNAEMLYEIAHGFGGSNTAFGIRNIYNQNARYNIECRDCKNIFGCEGLRKKQYCILNKQYSKEEYEELVPKIIKHMSDMPYKDKTGKMFRYGEFFPAELSPFAYNETIAQEYIPLTKEEALSQGHAWQDGEIRNHNIDMEKEMIPDRIEETTEDILNKIIACSHSGRCKHQCTEAFKILPEELRFYKRMNLPLPRLCPNCRHYERISSRNPLKLWDRNCMCDKKGHFHKDACTVEFKTTYSPERPEIIYCEKCYQQAIY